MGPFKRESKKDTASFVVAEGFSALSLLRVMVCVRMLKVFGGLWNVKFVDFTKLLKKRKIFSPGYF